MISICCCAINAKYDIEAFVRALRANNIDTHFEIVLTHDDRVEDGSTDYLANLQQDIPNLKIVKNTNEDTIRYLRNVIDFYHKNNLFTSTLRSALQDNVEKYAAGDLLKSKKTFLWLSSSVLYNKAVSHSSGDILVITPADFVYLFKLNSLKVYVKNQSRDGHFYGKPNAIWARISNQEKDWLSAHVKEIHQGINSREGYRWDSREPFRDYLRAPEARSYLPDFRNNKVIDIMSPESFDDITKFCIESFALGGLQALRGFHGFHVLTRKTFDTIGGFNEIYPGRAFADDCMTKNGTRYPIGQALPPEFSIAWCGQSEISAYQGPGYSSNWADVLAEKDPYLGTHPIPNGDLPTYLHQGLIDNSRMSELANTTFRQWQKPVRLYE